MSDDEDDQNCTKKQKKRGKNSKVIVLQNTCFDWFSHPTLPIPQKGYLTKVDMPDLKGKTVASRSFVDMHPEKRAGVEDLVTGSLKKSVNKHVKGKVLEVRHQNCFTSCIMFTVEHF